MPRPPRPLSKGYTEETAIIQRIHRRVAMDTSIHTEDKAEMLKLLDRAVSIFNNITLQKTTGVSGERTAHAPSESGEHKAVTTPR